MMTCTAHNRHQMGGANLSPTRQITAQVLGDGGFPGIRHVIFRGLTSACGGSRVRLQHRLGPLAVVRRKIKSSIYSPFSSVYYNQSAASRRPCWSASTKPEIQCLHLGSIRAREHEFKYIVSILFSFQIPRLIQTI